MSSTTPKKNDPLTLEEMTAAADIFFPLFNVIHGRMPTGSTTEDTLKIMESVAKLGHKQRAEEIKKKVDERFGFVKDTEENADE